VHTAVVILAGGESARMGYRKELLPFRGIPLVRHAASTALAAGLGPVVVVLGAHGAQVRTALLGLDVTTVVNEAWRGGIGTSIRAGVGAVDRSDEVRGLVLMLADQPLVTAEILGALVQRHVDDQCAVVAARYSGTVGVPAYFARGMFGSLLELGADQGCKRVIVSAGDRAALVDCPEAAFDVDTPDDRVLLDRL